MKLEETIELMTSSDYKERFKAEYYQLKIRYEKLKTFNQRISIGQMSGMERYEPKHDCPLDILQDQQHLMGLLLDILEKRAIIENVEL